MMSSSIVERIVSLGCIVCRNNGYRDVPAAFHHIHTQGKRRAGKEIGIPLCGPHHQDQGKPGYVARHPYKRQFEAEYGSEWALYDQVLKLLEEKWPTLDK